jgi:phage shock protein A
MAEWQEMQFEKPSNDSKDQNEAVGPSSVIRFNKPRDNQGQQMQESPSKKQIVNKAHPGVKRGGNFCTVCRHLQKYSLFYECPHMPDRGQGSRGPLEPSQKQEQELTPLEAVLGCPKPKASEKGQKGPKTSRKRGALHVEHCQEFHVMTKTDVSYEELQKLLEMTEHDLADAQTQLTEQTALVNSLKVKSADAVALKNYYIRELIMIKETFLDVLRKYQGQIASTSKQMQWSSSSINELRLNIVALLEFCTKNEGSLNPTARTRLAALQKEANENFARISEGIAENAIEQRGQDKLSRELQLLIERLTVDFHKEGAYDPSNIQFLGDKARQDVADYVAREHKNNETLRQLRQQIGEYQLYIEKYIREGEGNETVANEGIRGALKKILQLQKAKDELDAGNSDLEARLKKTQKERDVLKEKIDAMENEAKQKRMLFIENYGAGEGGIAGNVGAGIFKEHIEKLEMQLSSQKLEILNVLGEKQEVEKIIARKDDEIAHLHGEIRALQQQIDVISLKYRGFSLICRISMGLYR